jgi:hypothetical protein
MSPVAVISFQEALAHSERASTRHLLLGNGFSIACRPNIFVYGKLFERANFAKLSPAAQAAFAALGTEDFERVIKALRDAAKLIPLYKGVDPGVAKLLEKDADGLKEVLVQTIAASHPARPGDILDNEYAACRAFLAHFKTVYSLNYDLLLYWAQMHTEPNKTPDSDDGFRKSEDDIGAGYVVWESGQSHDQNMWFLHGALHVFDTGTEVQKYTWINTGIPLIDQIRDALARDYFPLFVAEGNSSEKLERIRHSDYLAKAYRSFSEIGGALFVFGHAFASNDEHYLKRIERGKIRYLYVGLHGDPKSVSNQHIIARASLMTAGRNAKRPLDVMFYNSKTAHVWG